MLPIHNPIWKRATPDLASRSTSRPESTVKENHLLETAVYALVQRKVTEGFARAILSGDWGAFSENRMGNLPLVKVHGLLSQMITTLPPGKNERQDTLISSFAPVPAPPHWNSPFQITREARMTL
jgi:hypothetical protein